MAARKKTEGNNGAEHRNIALRAYAIYVDEGCPAGRELAHWQQAERDLLAELSGQGDGGKQSNAATPRRRQGPNADWQHLFNRDVISVPDKWEFPWHASWDLGFQMIPTAQVDPDFAKKQCLLFLREWYMHPNGQLPAYEMNLSDTNPPVHAWACRRVFEIDAARRGTPDHGASCRVIYEPGESQSTMFGGNSNWRGPVWLPINYLFIHALRQYGHFYGDRLTVPNPKPDQGPLTLSQAANEIASRCLRLFMPSESGTRPCNQALGAMADRNGWRDMIFFHEYFHADTGKGLGASHQLGWTSLIASLLIEGSGPETGSPCNEQTGARAK